MPAKEMGPAYQAAALQCLGCEKAVFTGSPLFGDAVGVAFTRAGALALSALPRGEILPDAGPLPLADEGLAAHLQKKTTFLRGGEGLFAAKRCRDAKAALAQLRPRLTAPLYARLSAFLAMRPCFAPALRPGLGIVWVLDAGGKPVDWMLCALLLPGFGSAPMGFYYPVAMNLELTSQCPLHCPQCYCYLQAGRHMPLSVAENYLRQAGKLGVRVVNLSGGETMCYPWICEVVAMAHRCCGEANVALSGYGITPETLDGLLAAGATGFYVSLNGPTEAVNAHTRDGYALAVHTLELLQQRAVKNVWINWVVHDSNADTFPQMIALGERYGVTGIMIMAFKPDSHHELPSLPTAAQMGRIARWVHDYRGALQLEAETCYSSMRALLGKTFWGNSNKGPFCGCGAGRDSFSVSLEGRLSPCRHLELYEDSPDLLEYWQHSPELQRLRQAACHPLPPCDGCDLREACRHCMAVNLKLHGCLTRGDTTCPLAAERQEGKGPRNV